MYKRCRQGALSYNAIEKHHASLPGVRHFALPSPHHHLVVSHVVEGYPGQLHGVRVLFNFKEFPSMATLGMRDNSSTGVARPSLILVYFE